MIEVFALVDEVLKSKVVEIIVGDERIVVELINPPEQWGVFTFDLVKFLVVEKM